MASQNTLAAVLASLAPLGPNEEPDEREKRTALWLAAAGAGVVDDLVELAAHPPPQSALGRVELDRFEFQISKLLALAGSRDPTAFLPRVGPHLAGSAARRTLVEVIGAIGSADGLKWLAPLVETNDLSEDEATRLACAIGEIGGPKGAKLLDRLEARLSPRDERARNEIRIARRAQQRADR
jgi:hypothetical protein